MATGKNIRTYTDGAWQHGDAMIMRAADHGAWLGSSVFDGARFVDGLAPDLEAHCARVNRSAEAMMLKPTVSTEDMVEIVREGLKGCTPGAPVYIRPMYWGIHGDATAIVPLARKAARRVKRPAAISRPHTSSITPPIHSCEPRGG